MLQTNRLQFYSFFLSILWITNDSILKIVYPGLVTGKISDLIGILLTPLVLTGIFSTFLKKHHLNIVFWTSLVFTDLLFLCINLSQNFNNAFYQLIGSKETMNLADRSDLFLLPLSLVTIYLSKQSIPFLRISLLRKFFILIFPTLALINTSYPQGRSDVESIILLSALTNDTIIQLDPKEVAITDANYIFKFRFIGMNNESSPKSTEIPNQSATCPNPSDLPIEKPNTESSYSKSGKFQNYRIEFSKSKNFETIDKTSDCLETECTIDLQVLSSGDYFWRVRLRYLYISECKLYLENFTIKQEIHSFTK
ncbi:hypothetical protein [Leptospira brenneri]|uniref:Uncharacterized protein n=1 Tax=Leptospira brenneri TaxID=2023182 RepID=A0A2M9Y3C5_9LEPT|nr:hypothetical protein [Leptospira brenneri]PJZ45906.1 hypothetical protein CH361_07965 [Leptospira brenneri]TGK91443.1 hypothetical protein EHQ30_14580 [Leptospira brenneri]